jgi:hypothetical protein
MRNPDNLFKFSLVFSVVIHAAVLTQLSNTNTRYFNRPVNRIEVVYRTPPQFVVPKEKAIKDDIREVTQKQLPPDAKMLLKERSSGPSPLEMMEHTGTKLSPEKTLSSKINTFKSERKISVPALKTEKISNPVYLNYYQLVRGRIQDRAYQNYERLDIGEVYLTFVLSSNGMLKQLKLIEERTTADGYLRNVGLRSIQEASPFPAFPKDLDYPELSFNVVISFEVKN